MKEFFAATHRKVIAIAVFAILCATFIASCSSKPTPVYSPAPVSYAPAAVQQQAAAQAPATTVVVAPPAQSGGGMGDFVMGAMLGNMMSGGSRSTHTVERHIETAPAAPVQAAPVAQRPLVASTAPAQRYVAPTTAPRPYTAPPTVTSRPSTSGTTTRTSVSYGRPSSSTSGSRR